MSLRNELALLAILVGGITLASFLGGRSGVRDDLADPRTSTLLAGPEGALGFARALEHLGVEVETRRRPLFDVELIGDNLSREILALVNMPMPPTEQELLAVSRYVEQGGRVLVVGDSAVAACFGYLISRRLGDPGDSISVDPPFPGWSLPATTAVLVELPAHSFPQFTDAADDGCVELVAVSVDTSLVAGDGRAVALHKQLSNGGSVKLLADSRYLTNRTLKESDAGLFLLPWVMSDDIHRVVVDEYHQGFGHRASLFSAAWRWLNSTPGGWTILHLGVVALLALAVAAIRFGPPVSLRADRRRSELEHLEALAVGLRRAQGWNTARVLLTSGLRRRLGRTGHSMGRSDDVADWLPSLVGGAKSADVQRAVRNLQTTNDQEGDGSVLITAQAVEEIWKTLGPKRQLGKS
jgi:hypothetical protein